MLYATLPSSTESFTPVTVIVRGVFQFAVVNVTLLTDGVPSPVLLLLSGTTTLLLGWLSRTIVNVAVPPASVVDKPDVGLTVMPAVSLSMLVTDTSAALRPL